MKKLILSLTSLAAFSTLAAGSVVKIVGTEGSWGLTFNGKPYFVNGGGSKALLKEIGGNSFRTWGANAAKKDLDEAAKYGETVTIGFWLGHSKHGFSYKNPKALDDSKSSDALLLRCSDAEVSQDRAAVLTDRVP